MMTKTLKNTTTTIALFCSLILSGQVRASDQLTPYIGASYQLSHIKEKGSIYTDYLSVDYDGYFSGNFNNLNLFAGFGLKNTNLSFEIEYFRSGLKNKTNNNTGVIWPDNFQSLSTLTTSRLKIINLEAIYNHKIFEHDKLSFLAIAGLSKVYFDSDISLLSKGSSRETVNGSQDGYGLNFGAGLETNVADNLSIRAITKYITANNIDSFKSLISYNLGFKYNF